MTEVLVKFSFPEGTSAEVARDVTSTIMSGVVSDLQAISNGGMTAEEAFGEGAVAPTSVQVMSVPQSMIDVVSYGPQQGGEA
jgi:hypothetical protein